MPPIGLIAGQGRLPILNAIGMRAAGHKVACVGLHGQFSPELPELCDQFGHAGIIQIGKWIRTLQAFGVQEAVMAGRVKKVRMYDPLRWFRQLPDWRAITMWYHTLRHDKRNDAILGAVADELQKAGITLIDSTKYIPEQMAELGVMTKTKPSTQQLADIEFALPIVQRMGDLDVGQSIAVKERDIISVEAIEGTDAMIRRTGMLCRKGKWTLIKVAKPNQDMRFDVPTIGLLTLENLKATGGTCMAVEADKVILLDKPQLLETADKMGIAIIGFEFENQK